MRRNCSRWSFISKHRKMPESRVAVCQEGTSTCFQTVDLQRVPDRGGSHERQISKKQGGRAPLLPRQIRENGLLFLALALALRRPSHPTAEPTASKAGRGGRGEGGRRRSGGNRRRWRRGWLGSCLLLRGGFLLGRRLLGFLRCLLSRSRLTLHSGLARGGLLARRPLDHLFLAGLCRLLFRSFLRQTATPFHSEG